MTGQLTNIYHISDPRLSKQAVLQVIQSMKDETSLPWGLLEVLGLHSCIVLRLSSSQIALASSQAFQPQRARRVCKFYNDGSCTHEGQHGQYLHYYGLCYKQGKSAAHPEVRCNTKTKGFSKQSSNNSSEGLGRHLHDRKQFHKKFCENREVQQIRQTDDGTSSKSYPHNCWNYQFWLCFCYV